MSNSNTTVNVIAGLASFFIPGLGQLLQQRYIAAILFFGLSVFFWFSFLGGLSALLPVSVL